MSDSPPGAHDGGSVLRSGRPATFVLGTGAQKAGTTWLAEHLRLSPEFHRGYRKEYHVFDAVDLASERWMLQKNLSLARDALDALEGGGEVDAGAIHRMAMTADHRLYFEFFAALVARRPQVRATGDLTPDYAMLPTSRMSFIRQGFEDIGMRAVAVFLMRDPVDRVWSHLRMRMHRNPERFSRSPVAELVAEHGRPAHWIRTQYHHTVEALASSFGTDRTHLGLYETLFVDRRQVDAITDLVGISAREPDLTSIRNSSPRTTQQLPNDVARQVAEHYADTYREIAAGCPELAIESHWPNARFVL